MSAIEEARKLESEFTTAYISLRQEAEANYQRIQALLERGNPTPEEVQVVNDAAARLNERIQSTVQPLIRQLGVVEREVGFFDRSAFREITQRIQQEIANFGQFATQSRTARESLNKLSNENQTATAKATADKAAADQGPQTSSAGEEVTASGNTTQAPAAPGQQQAANGSVTTASTTTQPCNAEKFAAPGNVTVAPSATALPSASTPNTAATAGSGPVVGASINTGTGGAREAAPLPALAPLPYKAVTVVSSFERGRFTQELEGVLLIFTAPPRRTVYRDSDDNLAYEYTADDNLAYENTPTDTPTQPSKLSGPVAQNPNASNLAQQPTSTPGQPTQPPASTTTLAPAQTAPATSGGQPIQPVTQPDPVALQELEQRLASLEEERRRIRQLADLNGPLQREIESLRARIPTITDPLEQQRAQARLAELQNEINQARERFFVIADEIQETDNAIFSLQSRSAPISAPSQNMAREN